MPTLPCGRRFAMSLALLFTSVAIVLAQEPQWSVTLAAAPVRIYPDLNRTPLATLPPGTPVQILEQQGEWLRISFRDKSLGDRVGFVRREHVRPAGQNQPSIVPAPSDRPQPVTLPPPAADKTTDLSVKEPVGPPAQSVPADSSTSPVPAAKTRATYLTKDGRVKVFVTSAATADGFTDPDKGNRDTIKDLQDSIRDKRSLALAESRDDAAIVLVVMGRETAQVTAGFLGDPARDRIIRVKFQFGDFQTEMTASAQGGTLASGGAWGKAAGKIANQVDEWVRANSSKLGVSGR